MTTTLTQRIFLCAFLLIPAFSVSANPASGESPTIQFCGLGEALLNPKGNVCLRLKEGRLYWHSKQIAEAELINFTRAALRESKRTTIAIFPSPMEKFGDVFRLASTLGTLPVKRIYITPPISDEEFDQKTKDAK